MRSIHSTLTRHFLRGFLENDLIAPEADRSQLLAIVGAALFSTTLLITLFMSFVYVIVPMTPSQLAIAALDARFFYIALSMVVCALLAVAQWDALVVDVRDAAILEPLPVRPTTVRRAKLAAVGILGAAAAATVNLMPTLIFPWLLVYQTRASVAAMFALMFTHAAVTGGAGAFAYLSVIALREGLSSVFPRRWFSAISPAVQGALIVLLGSALLLIPPSSSRIERHGFEGWRALSPPMWFLGVYEVAGGDIIREAFRATRPGPRRATAEAAASQAYDRHKPTFSMLARRAVSASASVVVVAIVAYWFNARRFPAAAPAQARRRRWRIAGDLARTFIVHGQTARAGFFFALAAIWRSSRHRLTLAGAGAAGLDAAVVTLSGIDVQDVSLAENVPSGVLAIQPIFIGALLVAFRHAVRVPAELRANWAFQLAWASQNREFLTGVRRAALTGIVVPGLALLFPLFWFLLGWPLALAHACLGFAGATLVLEALFVAYEKVPFTCTYLPNESLKAFGILYVVVFLIGASTFASMERAALQDLTAAIRLVAVLAVIGVALRVASRRSASAVPVDFDEAPVTTQRLGLHT